MGMQQSKHAIIFGVGNTVALFGARFIAQILDKHYQNKDKRKDSKRHHLNTTVNCRVAKFVLIYYTWILVTRLKEYGSYTLLEMLWGCNVSLIQAALGVLLDSPLMVGSAVTTVAIDQICWYVDILGYIATKKFIVGVTKYITLPETGLSKIYTAMHHLWFMPLFFWVLRRHGYVRSGSWTISCGTLFHTFQSCFFFGKKFRT